jgi:hypothetical protein
MAGDLQRAIDELETCAVSSCPAVAQRECSHGLEAARAAMPAIKFEVRFAADLGTRPVMLSVDEGEPRRYEGEVLRVNPGKHRFVFQCEGCAAVTRRIVFSEQDSKRKEVVLKPALEAGGSAKASQVACAEERPSTCPPAAALPAGAGKSSEPARAAGAPTRYWPAESAGLRDKLILGSAAALATVGGLGFIGFGLDGRRGERALRECSPYCSGARIAEVKRSYLLANLSLGSAVLALGSATLWWFGLRRSPQDAGSYADSRGEWSVEVGAISKVTRTF